MIPKFRKREKTSTFKNHQNQIKARYVITADFEVLRFFFKVAGVGRASGETASREKRGRKPECLFGLKRSLCQNTPCMRTRRILREKTDCSQSTKQHEAHGDFGIISWVWQSRRNASKAQRVKQCGKKKSPFRSWSLWFLAWFAAIDRH